MFHSKTHAFKDFIHTILGEQYIGQSAVRKKQETETSVENQFPQAREGRNRFN